MIVHVKSHLPFWFFSYGHEPADGLEDGVDFSVMLFHPLLEFVQPSGELFVRQQCSSDLDKSPHDVQAHLQSSLAVQYICCHDCAVLGERKR